MGMQKASAATDICPGCVIRFPPEEFWNSDYSLHGFGGISTKPSTPCEPTKEMALVLIGEQVCARGTLRDEAGALPIKITAATVARILVVRIGGHPRRELSGLDLLPN